MGRRKVLINNNNRFYKLLNNKILLVFLISFIGHLIPVFIIKYPTSAPDEVLTLAPAAILAGKDWTWLTTAFGTYYGIGNTWFLAWLFKITSDGMIIYNFSRICMAFFLSFPAVICYKLIRIHFKEIEVKEAALVAICATFITNATADILCGEPILTFSTWAFIYLIIKLLYNKSKKMNSLLLLLLYSYIVLCHQRSYVFIIPIVYVVVWGSIKRKKSIINLKMAGVGLLFVPIAYYIKMKAQNVIYGNIAAIKANDITIVNSNETSGLVSNFLETIKEFGVSRTLDGAISITITNVYAMFVFSVGLLALGMAGLIVYRNKEESEVVCIIDRFCFCGLMVSLLGMGIIHCWHGIYLADGHVYGDGRFFFYLRYYINFFAPIFLNIIVRLKRRYNPTLWAVTYTIVVFLALLYFIFFQYKVIKYQLEIFDVGKLFESFSCLFGSVNYYWTFKIGLLVLVVINIINRRSKDLLKVVFLITSFLLFQQSYQCLEFRKPISDLYDDSVNAIYKETDNEDLKSLFKEANTLYVLSNKTYRLEYLIQLLYSDMVVKRYEVNSYNGGIIFSNSKIDGGEIENLYEVQLDEDEYLYTDSYDYYRKMSKVIEKELK